jgi:outer membrane immunogenic protein
MKRLFIHGGIAVILGAANLFAGPEPLASGKEMKQVAPAPAPICDWTGFYVGVHGGGQFGHSEDKDLDGWNSVGINWGYSENGLVAGGQIGYNWQWHWLVLGPEIDLGYMNLDGNGLERAHVGDIPDTRGVSASDFYATFRGRVGVAFNHWLFYGTGGGIGVNWDARVEDPDLIGTSKKEFDWGWTGGGGIEYMLGCHWTVKTEYLHYKLDHQTFTGKSVFSSAPLGWRAETEGHIVRAGLNYKF